MTRTGCGLADLKNAVLDTDPAEAIEVLEDIASDTAFWAAVQRRVTDAMFSVFAEFYMAGMKAGLRAVKKMATKALDDAEIDILISDPAFASSMGMTLRAYTDTWWSGLDHTTRSGLFNVISDARRDGSTMPQIVNKVSKLFGPSRAQAIAATETTRLFGAGSQASYRALKIEWWKWRTAEDSRVDPACDGLSAGGPYPMTQEFAPAHVSCLLPGTICTEATVLAATRRWYEGQALVIRTASGDELAVTPNHPILTRSGWQAAGSLAEGDEVIRNIRERVTSLVDPDDVEMPTLIEQVAGSLSKSLGAVTFRVPTATEDFHGDGADGDVDVVTSAGLLVDSRHAALSKIGDQAELSRAAMRSPHLPRLGATFPLALCRDAADRGGVGRSHLSLSLIGGHARPLDSFGRALAPHDYAILKQPPSDSPAVDVKRLGDGVLRLSGFIAKDNRANVEWLSVVGRAVRVTSIEAIRYAGHVFNLQTVSGYYTANGIVTGNCRCWPSPTEAPGEQPETLDEYSQTLADSTRWMERLGGMDDRLGGGDVIESRLWRDNAEALLSRLDRTEEGRTFARAAAQWSDNSQSISRAAHDMLRGFRPPEHNTAARALLDAVERGPTIETPLYRGLVMDNPAAARAYVDELRRVGSLDIPLSSASVTREVAERYAQHSPNAVLLNIAPGSPGTAIAHTSSLYADEVEFIASGRYRVKAVREIRSIAGVQQQWEVDLEPVGRLRLPAPKETP